MFYLQLSESLVSMFLVTERLCTVLLSICVCVLTNVVVLSELLKLNVSDCLNSSNLINSSWKKKTQTFKCYARDSHCLKHLDTNHNSQQLGTCVLYTEAKIYIAREKVCVCIVFIARQNVTPGVCVC